ncbi:MAG: pyridoxal phosphate-dependent aminotransferase family protein [Flavobacteriales bacterium]|nr:pyridoxal phosphate-dependent aminotransferase family protein [Flavobacteriales bacterium]
MESPWEQRIRNELDSLKNSQSFRTLRNVEGLIDFMSNDFLGLGRQKITLQGGSSGGSRLMGGNSSLAEELEQEIAQFHQSPSALLFGSGYLANLGAIQSVTDKHVVVLYDEFVHASIRMGIQSSLSKSYKFKHNDLNHLEDLLKKQTSPIMVVTESLFSMHADWPNFHELVDLKNKYDFLLMVDEAHSSGLYDNGSSAVEHLGLSELVDLRVVTYGKAFGWQGASVLSSEPLRHVLINKAKSFIYTTAASDVVLEGLKKRYADIAIADKERNQLKENLEQFGQDTSSGLYSPIVLLRGDISFLKEVEASLIEKKIAAKTIFAPTVKPGDECIRLCLHSFNTEEEILNLIKVIS